jgi:hypothetical protein
LCAIAVEGFELEAGNWKRRKRPKLLISKSRRTQSLLTGSTFRGEALKVARRVAGAAAGGAQRVDGGGSRPNIRVVPCVPVIS